MDKNKFPILLVNSPSTKESKVELPGDPISILYATRDLFNSLNNKNSQSNISPEIINHSGQPVYDPRIWDNKTKEEFNNLLNEHNPLAVFFCTYSPTHSYALDMAREIKNHNPESLVIFGGKHQDETIRYNPLLNKFYIESCNTLKLMEDKKIPELVDLVVSGDGERPLKYITEKIGEYQELQNDFTIKKFKEYFLSEKENISNLNGESIIGLLNEGEITLEKTNHTRDTLLEFGSPYASFPIKTKNPIFKKSNVESKLTTNLITDKGCKNTCIYCSESSLLNKNKTSNKNHVDNTLERIIEDITLGSEAMFFDDSIFFRGNFKKINEFSNKLLEKKKTIQKELQEKKNWGEENIDSELKFLERLNNFEYAVQFCVEDVIKESRKEDTVKILKTLRESGCSYVYVGLESLDDKVMENVQKFNQKNNNIYDNWFEKVNSALDLFKEADLRVGASLLFGIPGETYETIDNTINLVKKLIDENKLYLLSPNLCSYHPGTKLTKQDNKIDSLNYTDIPNEEDPLMSFFEEASEGHLSKVLTKEMIIYIKQKLEELENLNSNTMGDTLNEKK